MNTKYFIVGYYGDDRPRKRGLNEIEGDYYDYIEMEDEEDEEGNRDYVNIPAWSDVYVTHQDIYHW